MRALVAFAQDMLTEIAKVWAPNEDPNAPKKKLQMRIGIHSGSIVAGVIGTKTLRYDMWGPDVLVANQIEENGVAGQILVSEGEQSDDLFFVIAGEVAIERSGAVVATLVPCSSKPITSSATSAGEDFTTLSGCGRARSLQSGND